MMHVQTTSNTAGVAADRSARLPARPRRALAVLALALLVLLPSMLLAGCTSEGSLTAAGTAPARPEAGSGVAGKPARDVDPKALLDATVRKMMALKSFKVDTVTTVDEGNPGSDASSKMSMEVIIKPDGTVDTHVTMDSALYGAEIYSVDGTEYTNMAGVGWRKSVNPRASSKLSDMDRQAIGAMAKYAKGIEATETASSYAISFKLDKDYFLSQAGLPTTPSPTGAPPGQQDLSAMTRMLEGIEYQMTLVVDKKSRNVTGLTVRVAMPVPGRGSLNETIEGTFSELNAISGFDIPSEALNAPPSQSGENGLDQNGTDGQVAPVPGQVPQLSTPKLPD